MRTIESWRFKVPPSPEEYNRVIEILKRRLMERKNITNLDGYKFLKVEDSASRTIHMWLLPKDFKE